MNDKTMITGRAAAAIDRRASGAAGTHHDRRTKRVRTRGAAKRAAIRDGR